MKLILKLLLTINLLFSFNACDILEENPKDFISPDTFFKTEDEVKSALYGVYEFMHNDNIGDYMKIFIGDLGVDEMLCRTVVRINVCQYYEMESLPNEFSDIWREHYKAIGAANMMINRTLESNLDENFKQQVVSEAKVLRAFFYYGLIMFWGDVPMWFDELNIENVSNLPRSSRVDIVNQLNVDLDEAAQSLPDSYDSKNIGRITCWAAKALQARINILESNWQKAYDVSKNLIDNSPHDLLDDYNAIFDYKNKQNKEIVFFTSSLTDVKGSKLPSFTSPRTIDETVKFQKIFDRGLTTIRPDGIEVNKPNQLFQGWGMFSSSVGLLNSYEIGDSRKDIMDWNGQTMSDGSFISFDGGNGGGSGHYMLKWAAFDDKSNNSSRDICHIRMGEIYLIMAESANELGKKEEAINALNALRERAFNSSLHNYPNDLDKDAIKKAIVNENKWELAGEGVRRWYLCHWGYDYLYDAVQSLKDENPKAAANIKSHHILFKIPSEEFIKNPNLGKNNPGY